MLLFRCLPHVHSPFWLVGDVFQDVPFANEEDDDTGRDYLCPRTRAPVSPTIARPLTLDPLDKPGQVVVLPPLLTRSSDNQIVLRARHIPRRLNVLAEILSRIERSCRHPVAPCPDARSISHVSRNRKALWAYTYPPPALLPRVLEKDQQDQCELTLIVTRWPQAMWFAILLKMGNINVIFQRGILPFKLLDQAADKLPMWKAVFLIALASGKCRGRTIVHEWGHYRWGLWDEYPVDKYPKVYEDDSGNMKGVQCGKYMKGKVHCVLEREGCTFEVDKSGAGVVASLMGDHRIPGSRELDCQQGNPSPYLAVHVNGLTLTGPLRAENRRHCSVNQSPGRSRKLGNTGSLEPEVNPEVAPVWRRSPSDWEIPEPDGNPRCPTVRLVSPGAWRNPWLSSGRSRTRELLTNQKNAVGGKFSRNFKPLCLGEHDSTRVQRNVSKEHLLEQLKATLQLSQSVATAWSDDATLDCAIAYNILLHQQDQVL
ncbi:hypothetical protein NP493_60g03005 [Ridgeia piscesae]|uniref:Calcium-activated chloride channel N-terminal domain-containing protein n=1 Tax=Ridgeia piscesae TaxID=27915 RepID=A0AAD9PAD5_RIDPI|nr:hypothetical protein NP493_60g03005 [Ridgeia piscesae]